MIAIKIFILLSLLLIAGKILRVFVPLLQRLYLPSSVIGGILGLIVIRCFPALFPAEITGTISKLPGFLINVVFASLFLGLVTPRLKEMVALAFPQLCFGQTIAWGQYVLGLGLTGFLLIPLFGVNPAFGNLLEIGFAGGHGTVGGMTSVFEKFDWSEGIALGYTMATAGMILAIVLGMILVNWATRRGHVCHVSAMAEPDEFRLRGLYRKAEQPAAGRQTVCSDSIDTLAWHIAILGLAIAFGYLLLNLAQWLEVICFPQFETRLFSGFPLFPLCMVGGLLIQWFLQCIKAESLIDHGQMKRLSGAALDFLVVSAVATIRLEVVLQNWLPLLILIVAGAALGVIMVLLVAPRLFRQAWFERAIADFGQSLGVTATGLLLLRTVDPENRTGAAEAFGYKQLLYEPFLGGGLCTALALTLVFTIGWFKVFVGCLILFLFWGGVTAAIMIRNRRG